MAREKRILRRKDTYCCLLDLSRGCLAGAEDKTWNLGRRGCEGQ